MQCTVKKTLEIIKETQNEAIIQVKSNQRKLYQEAVVFSEEFESVDKFKQRPKKAHGRIEERYTSVFEIPELLQNSLPRWNNVCYLVKVRRSRKKRNTKTKKWEESIKDSYYIATTKLSAKEFSRVIQNHWGIENVNHYVRDVSFGEDKSRIRKNIGVFAILTSFSLNIIRINNVKNVSGERFTNNGNLEEIFKYKGLLQH